MIRCFRRPATVLAVWSVLALSLGLFIQPAEAQKAPQPDLSEYRTVAEAITTRISNASPSLAASVPGYLGVHAVADPNGRLMIEQVEPNSPAAAAGLRQGDCLVSFLEQKIANADVLRELLKSKVAGDEVQVGIERGKQPMKLTVTLAPTSKVLKVGAQRPTLGLQVGDMQEGALPLAEVNANGPAEKAGLKKGDMLLKVDGKAFTDNLALDVFVLNKNPGDVVTVLFRREGKDDSVKVTLGAQDGGKGGKGAGWDNRGLGKAWKKNIYRLAIIGVEYADVKHNAKITAKDWEDSMFSAAVYNKTNATGQKVFGSMNDYYKEQSFGKLKIEGKMFEFVPVSKKRMDYTNKNALFNEAMEKLLARDGKDALKDLDGVFFLYAGTRPKVARGSLYWPHRSSFNFQGKSWPYFIVEEENQRGMNDTSVFCHEFGHMLGLPDLYARPENPGSEGLWQWCAMSNQIGGGQPQHFCAWSKEQLGWITPCVIDPRVKQKLILSPVEDSPKECFKVLVRPDGSEYFLLENRKKKGFDSKLPGEGLLVWRVVGNRPILEESHGVEGPSGPRVFLSDVPFPSPSNDAFTPYTIPSSRSQLGGGLQVHITNIRRLPDGRIAFHVGYEYL